MLRAPCPILVVTATVSGNYTLVCEALGHGAYDAVCTPVLGDRPPHEAGAQLLAKLASVDRIRRESGQSASDQAAPGGMPGGQMPERSQDKCPLVAIGASTGGPQALETILSSWPQDFPAAVVVVQHIAAEFAASLAQWLQAKSKLTVRTAGHGDLPRPGTVLVAATDDHLAMNGQRRLVYRVDPAESPYRPSVDVLFSSLAEHWTTPSVAVLLTGIGRDGAAGLLRLRQCGWHTLAQDESTSLVYGMPRAAAELGAARRVLPLEQIADYVANHITRLVR
jgi:chemotaxis response regulator CheB